MTEAGQKRVSALFNSLACAIPAGDLAVTSPADGQVIAQLAPDNKQTLEQKIERARAAQAAWSGLKREARVAPLEKLSSLVRDKRELLAELIALEGGKTAKEALAEVDGSADILMKTIKDATLPELNGMLRCKERPPVGVVGLITSFNFPLVVANWTLAPALLAANAVLWKPSEKTPLVALAYKAVFAQAMGAHADLLLIIIGSRDVGQALVSHESVDMISATGSVSMGQGIKAALAKKKNYVPPILELGGNNGVIISGNMSQAHLEWSVGALMNSFLGTTGQRCTNTRRLFVHESIYERAVELLTQQIEKFLGGGGDRWEEFGYGALIDEDAFARFERAGQRVIDEGGKILFGKRLNKASAAAFYVEPALALLPQQSPIMHEETFGPLLFVVPYRGDIGEAVKLVNAPDNAGLVNGIYTQSQKEADYFAALNEAGHAVINSPKGTGTPAFGMGFGGNKESGEGEILNTADPLRAFTRSGRYRRIAQNKDIVMQD